MTDSDQRHLLLRPRVALPFLLVALIWGSTWFVIKDQLAVAPPSWSVAYRFAIAAVGMFALAAVTGRSLRLSVHGQVLALAIGLAQFCINFNLVYRAELHLTSGIVAVLFGLLMLPNALLGRVFLGQEITPRFLVGSLLGLGGIILLLLHEANEAPPTGKVWLGVMLTVLGILSASSANIIQATRAAQRHDLLVVLAWAMGWGALADALFALVTAGPPVIPASARYWGGVAYLAIIGSVVTFPMIAR